MRIMLDTNILISAAIFKGIMLEAVKNISNKYQIVLSNAILVEFQDTVDKKFHAKKYVANEFLQGLAYTFADTPKTIKEGAFPSIRDPKDYPILASAIIADVDILITGDKDFSGVQIKSPKIMTLTQFSEKYM